ncbi:MAG: AI-2E family transporter [Oscillospiraceae bacterium]|nr:AI-2E family transporter [Oscillospiraceae bacterium]
MKKKFSSSYFKAGLAVFLTAAAILVLYNLLSSTDNILSAMRNIFRFVSSVLAPFTAAFIVAYLLNPLVGLLERVFGRLRLEGLRRALSIAVVYTVLLGLIAVFFVLGVPALANNIGDLINHLGDYYLAVQQWAADTLGGTILADTPFYKDLVSNSYQENLAQLIDWSYALQSTVDSLPSIFSTLSTSFFSALISVYMLFDKKNLLSFLRRLILSLMRRRGERALSFLRYCNNIFSSFVRGRLLDSLILSLVSLIGFYIIGIPYAPLMSVIIFLTNLIPYIGPLVGAVPPVLLGLLTNPISGLYVILLIILLQVLEVSVVGPRLMKFGLNINAFWVMVGIIVGGGLLGVLGMFIGVPLAAILKHLLDRMMEKRGHPEEGTPAAAAVAGADAPPEPGGTDEAEERTGGPDNDGI